jgi:signal transduction histidine kinase/CheY-like chemotaxis protein
MGALPTHDARQNADSGQDPTVVQARIDDGTGPTAHGRGSPSGAPLPLSDTLGDAPCASPDLLSDPDTAEATYEAVRGLAGGLVLIFAGFTGYHLTADPSPTAGLIVALDQIVIGASALALWLMLRRTVPVPSAHVVAVSLGLLVVADVAVSVIVQGEGSDLRYVQAIVVGGGAIALSARAFIVFLAATTAMAAPVAAWACSREELVDFVVMQCTTSMLSVALYYGRIRSQKRLLFLRQRGAQTAAELNAALMRASHELAERERAERERRELEDQLRQAQKLEALGTLAGGVAHDVNNVLGAITAVASAVLAARPGDAEIQQELADIVSTARRGETLTRNIMSFARNGTARCAPFRVDLVVAEVQRLLTHVLPKHVDLRVSCRAGDCWVDGDAGQFGHLLMNLCLNSAEAIDRHGQIEVATGPVDLDAEQARSLGAGVGHHVELTVRDDGCGIPPAALSRVFEPYFSTKLHLEHSGLGLSVAYGTVRRHRGAISIQSVVGQGTAITVVLPAREPPPNESNLGRNLLPEVDPARSLLLFVDDEPVLRRAGQRIGRSLGFEVLAVSDGREALEIYRQHRARIGAVVLDVAMPVMNGTECFNALRKLDSSLPIVLATGYAKDQDIQTLLEGAHVRFLRKPYDRDGLAEALAELLPGQRERLLSLRPARASTPSARA